MTDNQLQRLVIVGGGLAGWCTAAAAAASLRGSSVEIAVLTLPDQVNIDPVQYVSPEAVPFFDFLGIDGAELVRKTAATFRLGTALLDGGSEGPAKIRAFGTTGADIGFVHFHHLATKLHARGFAFDSTEFSVEAMAAKAGRFTQSQDTDQRLPPLAYGLSLNTDKLIRLLRDNALLNGVRTLESHAKELLMGEGGSIAAVILEDGTRLIGDFFVDCSGTAAMLIGDALGVGYEDWSHWLPCNRVASATTKAPPGNETLLRCVAMDDSWLLQSALHYRTAHQIVYASAVTSKEQVTDQLLQIIGDADSDALTFGEFQSGYRRAFWKANCLALGSAAGFVEPLEVSSLQLIQSGITRLLGQFPSREATPLLAEEYNKATTEEYESLRDFTLLSYMSLPRALQASPGCDNEALPETLQGRLALFRSTGRFVAGEHDSFSRDRWVNAMLLADIWPAAYDPLLDSMDEKKLFAHFSAMRNAISQAVSQMPTHAELLRSLIT